MSPPPSHAPLSASRRAKQPYYCTVNGLPKRRSALTGRGRAIAKHPAVYSPIWGNPTFPHCQEGTLLKLAEAASQAPIACSRFGSFAPLSTTTLNQNIYDYET